MSQIPWLVFINTFFRGPPSIVLNTYEGYAKGAHFIENDILSPNLIKIGLYPTTRKYCLVSPPNFAEKASWAELVRK